MTMVITPEIPCAERTQDVGFRWVSFARASLLKVGQFWMHANTMRTAFDQEQAWLEHAGLPLECKLTETQQCKRRSQVIPDATCQAMGCASLPFAVPTPTNGEGRCVRICSTPVHHAVSMPARRIATHAMRLSSGLKNPKRARRAAPAVENL